MQASPGALTITRCPPAPQPDALLAAKRAQTVSGAVLSFAAAPDGTGVVVSVEGAAQGAGGVLAGGIPVKMGAVRGA